MKSNKTDSQSTSEKTELPEDDEFITYTLALDTQTHVSKPLSFKKQVNILTTQVVRNEHLFF